MTGRTVVRIVVAGAVLLAALCSPASPATADEPGLVHVDTTHVGPRLDEVTFTTPALVGPTKVRILLPDGYDPAGDTRYPVLYLLHGGTGSYLDWTTQGDAEALSAGYPLIIVMPDGSGFGNYVDWWNFGEGGPPMWETYHIEQLLPWVDANYNTIPSRDARAIAGLSMGGGGAGHYASRHPDLFTAAGLFSGAVDTNTIPVQLFVQTSGLAEGHQPGAIFGHRPTDEVRWRGHNTWDLAENLQGIFLQLDTGNGSPGGPAGDTGDPVETGCWQMMTNLHDRLDELGYEHIWNDYGAGGHSWWYWKRDLSELLPRLMDRFAAPAPAPSPFTYTSIEASYDVWGWDVTIDRTAVEFSRLFDADASGFRLTGSGAAKVVTGPLFTAGQPVIASITDADGVHDVPLTADGDGRLTVPVSLGPANPHQQLSPQGTVWAATQGAIGSWPAVTATVVLSPAFDDGALPGTAEVEALSADPTAAATTLPATGGTPAGGDVTIVLLGALAALRALGSLRTRPGR
jgi:S-formylglutathione hydrolase FrmB